MAVMRVGCGGRWRWWVLVLLLVACQPVVNPVSDPPEDVSGMWQHTDQGNESFLLLTPDGEFRLGDDPARLFDSPRLMGRYRYEDGWFTFYNASTDVSACREAGRYAMVGYTPGDAPAMTLMRQADACDLRVQFFHDVQWTQTSADG